MQVIGLHIGGSFAEASVWSPGEKTPRAQNLFYLPRQSLRNALPKFLRTLAEPTFDAAFVTTRYLERLFDFRLGGGTAQLVTAGLERWPFLNAAPARTGWVKPLRSQPISSLELTFGVDERVDADGSIRQALSPETLAPFAEKMKLMQVKRVCVHFLHADRNPTHEERATHWLRENGFDVFTPPRVPNCDEGSRWRASTLEASFSGTFDEQRAEITAALAEFVPAEAIRVHDGTGFQPFAQAHRVGTLFADDALLRSRHPGSSWLRLDLESWNLLEDVESNVWRSPWGSVALAGPKRRALSIQPTCALESVGPGLIAPTERPEGFEPGPLCFGRGRKPLVFDLWAADPRLRLELGDQISEAHLARRDSALLALSRETKARDAESFSQRLRADFERWLLADLALDLNPESLRKVGRMSTALKGFNSIGSNELKETSADRAALSGLETLT